MSRRYGRRSFIPALLVSAVTPLVCTVALAGPVTNDTCATAEVIPAAGPFPHLTNLIDNLGMATTSGDPKPSCVTTYSRGVWYKFTPSVTAEYQIATCNPPTGTTIDDTVLSIYTSSNGMCGGVLAETSCNDDSCGRLAGLTATLTAGTTYYIVATRWGGGVPPINQAALQLEIATEPLNDSCTTAQPLPLDMPLSGSLTLGANDYEVSTSGPNCYDFPASPPPVAQTMPNTASGRDVAYSFTAPADGSYSFKAQHTVAGGNIIVHVATECPMGPGPHTLTSCLGAANRNANSSAYLASEEVACVPLTAGQTVYVYVDEAEMVDTGAQFTIEARSCQRETEPNDDTLTTAALTCGVVGSIYPQSDEDYYPLGTFPAGTRVFAMADGVSGNNSDFDMRIVTENDTLEYDDGDNSSHFGAASPNIAGCPLPGDPAFLRMTHFSPTAQAEPYHLFAVLQPPGSGLGGSSATPETEGNDTFTGANTAANLFFSGSISTGGAAGDRDLFKFCADKGDLIYLSIDGDPLRDQTPLDPAVFLYDANGKQLVGLSDGGNTSLSTPSLGTLSGTTPKSPGEAALYLATYSGIHYAGVNSQTEDQPYSTGDYLYSIALNCQRGDQLQTDLSISISDDIDPVGTNEFIELNINVTNEGSRTAVDPVWSMAVLPSTTIVDITHAPEWDCNVVAGVLQCALTTMCFPAGASNNFGIKLKTNTCIGSGPLAHAATITSKTTDGNPGNNSDVETTQVNDAGQCDDGEICTTADTCVAGVCVGGPPNDCNDGNVCTDETCVTGTGCVYTNNTNPCDDSNACTTADTCAGGACVGGPPLTCNDADVCTDDLCDSVIGCFTAFNTASCDDGNPCTEMDLCAAGVCIGGPPAVCAPQNDCQNAGICDPATGACAYYLKPDGTACNDGNPCTMNDACKSGACIDSAPVVCSSPPDACSASTGTCDPLTGMCAYPLISGDLDGDGSGDSCDDDIDGDGISNDDEKELGTSPVSKDSDGDNIDDCTEACPENDGSCFDGNVCTFDKPANTDGDDTIDALDSDSDNDGQGDNTESGDEDLVTSPVDRDNNGVPDYRQTDGEGGAGGNSPYSVSGGVSCAYGIGGTNSSTGGAAMGALGLVMLALRRRKR